MIEFSQTQSIFKLNNKAQRFLIFALSKMDLRNTYSVEITASEFSKHFNIKLQNSYHVMDCLTEQLFNLDITTHNELSETTIHCRLVSCVEYHLDQSIIKIIFVEEIVYLIYEFSKNNDVSQFTCGRMLDYIKDNIV